MSPGQLPGWRAERRRASATVRALATGCADLGASPPRLRGNQKDRPDLGPRKIQAMTHVCVPPYLI